jgi:hypothetical protein
MRPGYKPNRRRCHVPRASKGNGKGKGKSGRPLGSIDKALIEQQIMQQRELLADANYKIATEHMDQQIGWLEGLVAVLNPFGPDGTLIKGRDAKLYFRAFELYRDFLSMRAPYQSPRLSAISMVPQRTARTVVNVTILNERGEQVWADRPEPLKQIEGTEVAKPDEEVA